MQVHNMELVSQALNSISFLKHMYDFYPIVPHSLMINLE
jgi:hypothetical protein